MPAAMTLTTRPANRAMCCLVALVLSAANGAADTTDNKPAILEFFEKNVRPALVEHCYKCHSADAQKLKGGLHLDSRQGILQGGDSGPAVVPGQPTKSRLIEAIGYKNADLRMPPRAKLPDSVIRDLVKWVEVGVPWPAAGVVKSSAKGGPEFDLQERKRRPWAWQP